MTEKDPTLITLRELLLQDRLIPHDASGEVKIRCPIPEHDDSNPSATANMDKGLWNCHACGKGGTAVDYLVHCRGMDLRKALKMVKGTRRRTDTQRRVYALPEGEATHMYHKADGNIAFAIVRRPSTYPKNKCMPYSPAASGNEWRNELSLKKDRPIYRLPQVLAAQPTKRILVFEGEKCVDTWQDTNKTSCSTTWQGGCKAWMKTDWSPLQGRKVALVADADEPGRLCMRSLAAHLHSLSCDVFIMLPDGDDGADVHDWIENLGAEKTVERVSEGLKPFEPIESLPHDPDDKLLEEGRRNRPVLMQDNEYFKILGYAGRDNDQVIIIRNNLTKAMLSYGFTSVTAGKLLALAPLDFWTEENHISNRVLHTQHSLMVNQAYLRGRVNLARIVGRGASKGDDGIVFHFGDAVLRDGKEYPVDDPQWKCYYPELESLPRDKPDPKYTELCEELTKPFLDWHFSSKADALIWLGWVASALAGGAQNWRPLLWMCAPAKAGKSFLQTVVMEWFGAYATKHDNYTDAAVMRSMESDSLIVMLDECEPEDMPKQLLASLRITTGNSGGRIRAEHLSGTGVVHANPRASVYLSSVQLPALRETEASRTIICRLADPDNRTASEYMANLLAIQEAVSKHGQAIRNVIVNCTPLLVSRTNAWAQRLTDPEIGAPVRAAHVYAPVFAGCELLRLHDQLPFLMNHLQAEQFSNETIVPSTAVNLLSQILSLEVQAEIENPETGTLIKTGRGLYDAAHDKHIDVRRRAADFGIIADYEGLAIDHNNPRLLALARRYTGSGLSFKNLCQQIQDAHLVKGQARRFGHTRVVKNWMRLTPASLQSLNLLHNAEEIQSSASTEPEIQSLSYLPPKHNA